MANDDEKYFRDLADYVWVNIYYDILSQCEAEQRVAIIDIVSVPYFSVKMCKNIE